VRWQAGAFLAGSWMSFVKWKTASFFFVHSDAQGLPPTSPIPEGSLFSENPGILACGIAGRYARLVASDPIRGFSFLSSVQQLKKGCPRPTTEEVAAGVEKAIKALTSKHSDKAEGFLLPPDYIKPGTGVEYVLSRDTTVLQLKRTVRELFSGATYQDWHRYSSIFPSTSACFERPVAKGGSAVEIAHSVRAMEDWKREHGETPTTFETLLPRHEEKKHSHSMEDEHISNADVQFDLRPLELFSRDLYGYLLGSARTQASDVSAVGLAESLKIRVISKGRAALTKVLHPLQKFMWTTLRRHPVFKLIGEPVTEQLIQQALGAGLKEDELYLSGDYSAATDNLAPWVSEAIAEEISEVIGLTPVERALFIKSLIHNVFHVPKKEGKGHDELPQQWGQLMGSIVSFPVLCIANAALCRWAIEVSRQRVTDLRSTSLLINGDDVVFKTTTMGEQLWERITSFAGLETSLGKTYLSRSFAQINSVNFRRLAVPREYQEDGHTRKQWFEATPYVNLGLMLGLKRSGEVVGIDSIADTDVTLGERARALLGSCPDYLRESVMLEFLNHHKSVLDGCKVPWFVPERWGGVGLPSVPKEHELQSTEPGDTPKFGWSMSLLDRRIAARIAESNRRLVTGEHGKIQGKPKFPVGKPPQFVQWRVHKAVMDHIPDVRYGKPSPTQENQWSKLYKATCIAAYYVAAVEGTVSAPEPVDVGQLFLEEDRLTQIHSKDALKTRLRILKQNQKSWSAALHQGNLPPPLSESTVLLNHPDQPYLPATFLELYPREASAMEIPADISNAETQDADLLAELFGVASVD